MLYESRREKRPVEQPRSQGFSLGDLARAGIAKGKALGTRLPVAHWELLYKPFLP